MKVLPILLGGDLNCYGMALAFHEAGLGPSVALGRYPLGVTAYSRYVRRVHDARMAHDGGRVELIGKTLAASGAERAILVGCTDEYASFLIRRRDAFDGRFLIPSPAEDALRYADKAVFAEACRAFRIKTPRTVLLEDGIELPDRLPFPYPIVIKPAVSEEYWRHPFEGMRKVFFAEDRKEAEKLCETIRNSGFCGTLLLQERIPADDSDNYVLTVYSDRLARPVAMAYGRVLLEEHTPKGLGNHAAIVTEPPPPVTEKILAFLRDIGYCGFSNFDFLRHPKSGELYLLEMNLRQGRSNHYMTASGINPAGLILSDLLERQNMELMTASPDVFWYSTPLSVIYSRVKDSALLARIQGLVLSGRAVSPLHMQGELMHNPLRRAYVYEHERRIKKRDRARMAK